MPQTTSAVAKDPENMYSDATTVVSMKCLTCDTNLEITEIEWYYGENKVPSHNVALSQRKLLLLNVRRLVLLVIKDTLRILSLIKRFLVVINTKQVCFDTSVYYLEILKYSIVDIYNQRSPRSEVL